jgi:hypothetical protein
VKHRKLMDEDFVRCEKPHSRWYRLEPDDGRRWKKSGHLMIRVLRTQADWDWAYSIGSGKGDWGIITPPHRVASKPPRKSEP